MPGLRSFFSLEVEIDGGFISLGFHQPHRPLVTEICVLKNRVGCVVLERDFQGLPGYFRLLALRIMFGIKMLEPLIRIPGREHPEATISFYEGKGRNHQLRKFAWISSSQQIGSRLLSIRNEDYEAILSRLMEIK